MNVADYPRNRLFSFDQHWAYVTTAERTTTGIAAHTYLQSALFAATSSKPTSFDRVVRRGTATSMVTNDVVSLSRAPFPTPVVPERPGSRARESGGKVKLSFILQLNRLDSPSPPPNKQLKMASRATRYLTPVFRSGPKPSRTAFRTSGRRGMASTASPSTHSSDLPWIVRALFHTPTLSPFWLKMIPPGPFPSCCGC